MSFKPMVVAAFVGLVAASTLVSPHDAKAESTPAASSPVSANSTESSHLPSVLVERVVARLAGGDVSGALATLKMLEPAHRLVGQGQAIERLIARMRASAGIVDGLAQTLWVASREPEVGPWLVAEAAAGLMSQDPVMAGLLTMMVPAETVAGRHARVALAEMYFEHGLTDPATATLGSILGTPSGRLRGVSKRLVARLGYQATAAAEAERGWMLYDHHASKSARAAFNRALTLGKAGPQNTATADIRCWARIGAARANFSQRDWPVGKRLTLSAMADAACRTNPELPEAVVRLARNGFVAKDVDALQQAVKWLQTNAPEWGEQHGVPALPVLMAAKTSGLRVLARSVRRRLDERRWYDPVATLGIDAFLSLRKRRRHKAAAALLAPLAEAHYRHWRPGLWGQFEYWVGQAQWDAGDRTAALARWEQLVGRYPQAWYGLLAAAQLRREAPERLSNIADKLSAELRASKTTQVIAPGLATGFEHWGLSEALAHEFKAEGVLTDSDAARAAQRLTRLGLPSKATRLAQRAMKLSRPGKVSVDTHGLWRAAWPKPFEATLRRAVAVTKADPWFVWGVMRTESLFTPTIVSHAGARGLLQLMPGTARWLRRKLNDKRLGSGDMFDPLDNILLGSVFLYRLGLKYEGSKPLMLAAYNAGPGRLKKYVRKMLRQGAVPKVAEFVETLPWNEAKHYVRSVVTNWATYRLLYGCQCLSEVAVALPADYLSKLAKVKKRKRKRKRGKRRGKRR